MSPVDREFEGIGRETRAGAILGAEPTVMDDLFFVYCLAALIFGLAAFQVVTRRLDPFAPPWLFLVGMFQEYVVQPISYHEWALRVRGPELIAAASFRSFWAVAWMLVVYYFGPGKLLARILPRPPLGWSTGVVNLFAPVLFVYGLGCGLMVARGFDGGDAPSAEAMLLLQFPLMMLVAGVVCIVTGRQPNRPRPGLVAVGIGIAVFYMLIWMFIGKRSHSLFAVLTAVCAFYIPQLKRPSWLALGGTAVAGALAVGLSIGWRYHANSTGQHGSISSFVSFVTNFDPSMILEAVNLKDGDTLVRESYETEEIGGFYLMMATVPDLADYDHGASYLRIFSTFIPRLFWPGKPIFGRDQWIAAWIAGSEIQRDSTFTGPSIGILGACQLNGGDWGTLIVMASVGLVFRTAYEYFRRYATIPWVQVWWALTYYNAWLATVGDDPLTWFYYNYGFTTLPPLAGFWLANKFVGGGRAGA